LYLIFNEGYAATDAPSLIRPDLVREAIRLARLAVELLPASAEAQGLLALMLLTDARRAARTNPVGDLIALEQQDRSLWDRALIAEGTMLVDAALRRGEPGPYQTQAAIAALHGAAGSAAETDWRQIALLYRALLRWTPTPVVELNAAIALGMATRAEEALEWIARIEAGGGLASYHHLHAAKADLLRRCGQFAAAIAAYRDALTLATNPAERRFLEARLTELSVAAGALDDSGPKT
jgi:RNA polymerase sigma-70 factor (ECF subfamily)